MYIFIYDRIWYIYTALLLFFTINLIYGHCILSEIKKNKKKEFAFDIHYLHIIVLQVTDFSTSISTFADA